MSIESASQLNEVKTMKDYKSGPLNERKCVREEEKIEKETIYQVVNIICLNPASIYAVQTSHRYRHNHQTRLPPFRTFISVYGHGCKQVTSATSLLHFKKADDNDNDDELI